MTAAARNFVTVSPSRVCCCGCGESLEARRPQARYYDDDCRVRALRQRESNLVPDPKLLHRLELAEALLDITDTVGPELGLDLVAAVAWGVAA